ncbi:antibiotic biosynthesis monooxygenase [Terricaulis sp.]|uniref:antibiotic biosynthesis monooxygenase family protein n=1 Tax=Terricaulis sp. TaxID=2768686 RepID=UPI003784ADF8
MPHNSITRLRLRSIFSLGAFAKETREISAQLATAPGFLGGAVLAEGRLVFWTRSAWESLDAMKAFRDSGAHRVSMPKIQDWCDEAAVVQCDGAPLTDWDEIYALLTEKGRLTRLKRPNAAHEAKQFAKMFRWSPEQPIKPEKK